jgi:hypothetical protein
MLPERRTNRSFICGLFQLENLKNAPDQAKKETSKDPKLYIATACIVKRINMG